MIKKFDYTSSFGLHFSPSNFFKNPYLMAYAYFVRINVMFPVSWKSWNIIANKSGTSFIVAGYKLCSKMNLSSKCSTSSIQTKWNGT